MTAMRIWVDVEALRKNFEDLRQELNAATSPYEREDIESRMNLLLDAVGASKLLRLLNKLDVKT